MHICTANMQLDEANDSSQNTCDVSGNFGHKWWNIKVFGIHK